MKKCIPSYGFEGRPFARRIRRGEKGAPLRDAREPSRYRAWPNTQNHRKVSRSRTRNSHTLPHKITTRTPFSPDRMRKRCKGCQCAQATERHRTEMTQMRQGPPPGPQAPDPPFRSRHLAKAGPGGRGCGTGHGQPRPSLSRLRRSHRTRTTSSTSNQQGHHAGPPGGGGLPLPAAAAAAPFKTMKPKGRRPT